MRVQVILSLFISLLLSPTHAQDHLSSAKERLRNDLQQGIGARIQTSEINSLLDARRAAGEFANYIRERTGHRLDPEFVRKLGEAEWRARASRSGNVPVAAFADTATRLFVAALGGEVPARNLVSSPFYVVSAEEINAARLFYKQNAPSLTQSDLSADTTDLSASASAGRSARFAYPIEAFLALYLCISEDAGLSEQRVAETRMARGLDAPAKRKPFGDRGYSVRRPISQLFSEPILSELLRLAD